jgi:hypothetical protein
MASANVLNLNDSNFDSEINKGATPILVRSEEHTSELQSH